MVSPGEAFTVLEHQPRGLTNSMVMPCSSPRSRAPFQRLGPCRIQIHWREQVDEINMQGKRKTVEDVHRWIEFLAFDTANVSSIHRGIDGQVLLRDPAFDPEPPAHPACQELLFFAKRIFDLFRPNFWLVVP